MKSCDETCIKWILFSHAFCGCDAILEKLKKITELQSIGDNFHERTVEPDAVRANAIHVVELLYASRYPPANTKTEI